MEDLPTEEKIEPHVEHHFAPGCYGREIFMPAGSVVVGKIHRHAHLNVLLEGECEVVTEHERERLTAPHVWVSTPGIKRAVHNITDVRWITFHPTEETDLTKIEAEVIAPSYDNLIEEAI
jgi:quercetin dioxygenase-like cupin family protein